MKAINAAILAMLAIIILASALAYDHADGETLPSGGIVISSDIHLNGDVRIESGSDVIIMDGANIDISDHTVTIGQGSKPLCWGRHQSLAQGAASSWRAGFHYPYSTSPCSAWKAT